MGKSSPNLKGMSAIGRIEFGADGVKVSGPNKDGGYTVTFSSGEYMQDQIAELLRIPQQTVLKVIVEVAEHG